MKREEFERNRKVWAWMREHLDPGMDDFKAEMAIAGEFDLSSLDAEGFWQAYRIVELSARSADELRPIVEVAKAELAKLKAKGWTDEEVGLNLCGRCYADVAIFKATQHLPASEIPFGVEWDRLHELMEVTPEDLVKHLPLRCR